MSPIVQKQDNEGVHPDVEMKQLESDGVGENHKSSSEDLSEKQSMALEGEKTSLLDSMNPFRFFITLHRVFGAKLLFLLFCSQHTLKGFVFNMINNPIKIILGQQYLQVRGARMQVLLNIRMVPWALKPVMGILSDYFPIFGFHKIPYAILLTVLGVSSMAMIGFCDLHSVSAELIIGGVFLIMMQLSACDLLTEAIYARNMKEHPAHGPSLMTYVWGGINLAGTIATPIVGWLVKEHGPQVPYIAAAIPGMLILIPSILNFFGEKRKTPAEVRENRQHLWDNPEALVLCVIMLLSSVALTVTGIVVESVYVNFGVALGVAAAVLISFSTLLNPTIAKVNAFFLIQSSLGLAIDGTTSYFYLDKADSYKDGPHFDVEFYLTAMTLISNLMSLVGIFTYQMWMSNWRYRNLLYFTNVAVCVLSLLDVVMYTRLNVALHIPDKLFVLGSSASQSVIQQWQWMPGVVILAHLCPHGVEATMYALLAGCTNLGQSIGSNGGAIILELLGVNPNGSKGEDAEFKNLWIAALIASVVPLLTMALIPILIPDASQKDAIVGHIKSASEGSFYQRYLKPKRKTDIEEKAEPTES